MLLVGQLNILPPKVLLAGQLNILQCQEARDEFFRIQTFVLYRLANVKDLAHFYIDVLVGQSAGFIGM